MTVITRRDATGGLMTRPLVTGNGGRGWKSRGDVRLFHPRPDRLNRDTD